MKRLSRILIQGLLAILPVSLTIYILYWSATTAEELLGQFIHLILPEESWYVPGMGLLAGLLLIFLLGLAMKAFLVQRLFDLADELMNHIPLIKTLYGSLKDFIGFFADQKGREFDQVVTVEMTVGDLPMRFLGFVTRTEFHDLPEGIGHEGEVAVYLPLSYQIGGYTIIVPRSAVKPVHISMQRAMGFAVTGGMFSEKHRRPVRKVKAEAAAEPSAAAPPAGSTESPTA